LKVLAGKGRKLKSMAMDMISTYYRAVVECLPNAAVIFDRYIMAFMNNTINTMRRELQVSLDDVEKKSSKVCHFLCVFP